MAASTVFSEIMVTFVNTKVDEPQGVLTDEPTRKIIAQQLAAFSKFIARLGMPA